MGEFRPTQVLLFIFPASPAFTLVGSLKSGELPYRIDGLMRQLHEINFFVWSVSKLEFGGGGVMCDSSLKIHYYTEDLSIRFLSL
jgi:hypothetical protein